MNMKILRVLKPFALLHSRSFIPNLTLVFGLEYKEDLKHRYFFPFQWSPPINKKETKKMKKVSSKTFTT